jgi:hypothetical protein
LTVDQSGCQLLRCDYVFFAVRVPAICVFATSGGNESFAQFHAEWLGLIFFIFLAMCKSTLLAPCALSFQEEFAHPCFGKAC